MVELIVLCRELDQEISAASEALVRFVGSTHLDKLQPDSSGRWRFPDYNYVTLKPQVARAKTLAVTLRGNFHEFPRTPREMVGLKRDQNGYSAFRLEKANQIAAAFACVERAKELFEKGANRKQTTPQTIG